MGIDNKTKKNASDILALKNKLTQKEDTINENERGLSFNRGFFFYMDQSYLVYDCKMGSFGFGSKDISEWKSTGIYNYSSRSNMNALANSKNDLPNLKNDGRMHVYLSGNIKYKMLYLELCKLLKMLLTIQKIIIKDMAYVLMKEVNLTIQ